MPTIGGWKSPSNRRLQVDAILAVRQERPGRRVNQQHGGAEDAATTTMPRTMSGSMPEAVGETGADSAEPSVGAHDAEPAHPVEEAGAAAGEPGLRAAVRAPGVPVGRGGGVESFCDMFSIVARRAARPYRVNP